ncbi:SigE family RNA polymerase sigma factor [Streptomyces smaragdinus]|uniref:RNA polymerase subunit sigma-24 n=1 Tax=Streptomyces smaragdinus TaxID=2585196 RepID=UPI001296E9AA|nr:RNA polymerase subunit sigma-24 [Streptomyces smaragdinus]
MRKAAGPEPVTARKVAGPEPQAVKEPVTAGKAAEPEPQAAREATEPEPQAVKEPAGPEPGVTKEAVAAGAAFDALYARAAPELTRQTYLLTGDHSRARDAVEHAFHAAWERWPDVARDRDPAGWVRAVAYDLALCPWRRLRARIRWRDAGEPAGDPADRELLSALLRLPAPYRRAVLLYDGAGLDLPETAAELEASTPATAGRITHAHEALTEAVPELRDLDETCRGELLHARLRRLSEAQDVRVLPPGAARARSERRTSALLKVTVALVAALIAGVVITTWTEPDYNAVRTIERPPWAEPVYLPAS